MKPNIYLNSDYDGFKPYLNGEVDWNTILYGDKNLGTEGIANDFKACCVDMEYLLKLLKQGVPLSQSEVALLFTTANILANHLTDLYSSLDEYPEEYFFKQFVTYSRQLNEAFAGEFIIENIR